MSRLLALAGILLTLGFGQPGNAQLLTPVATPPPPSSGAAFAGVGDAQSGANLHYGIIPYSAAYATALGNSFDYSCVNGGTQTGTVAYKSDGTLNLTAMNSACASATISVTKLYDDSGALRCTGGVACNLDTINAGTITFIQTGCPGTVHSYCLSLSSLGMKSNTSFSGSGDPQPFTLSSVHRRPTPGSHNGTIDIGAMVGSLNSADTAFCYEGGSVPTATMADASLHTLQCIFHDATQSLMKVDNAAAANISLGTTVGAGSFASIGITFPFSGYLYEVAEWPSDVGTTGLTNIAHTECVNSGTVSSPGC